MEGRLVRLAAARGGDAPSEFLYGALARLFLKRMRSVIFGEGELRPMRDVFDLSPSAVRVNQFGVDTDFWTPGNARERFVLAVGNDDRRDYDTLIAAAPQIDAEIRI